MSTDFFLTYIDLRRRVVCVTLMVFVISLALLVLLYVSLVFTVLAPTLLRFLHYLCSLIGRFLYRSFLLFSFLASFQVLYLRRLGRVVLRLFSFYLLGAWRCFVYYYARYGCFLVRKG